VSDVVEIRALRVLGHHGALPGEQDRAQPFELDLTFSYDMSAAGASDDLSDAVNYGDVARRAARVVEQRRFSLLEALAQAVAAEVLTDFRITEVTVALRKLRPPVDLDVASIGVVRHVSAGAV
jgi:dihydroneopterin aldolase